MNATVAQLPPREQPPPPQGILLEVWRRAGIFFAFTFAGLLVGLIVYLVTTTTYQARGTFLIDAVALCFTPWKIIRWTPKHSANWCKVSS